MECYISGTGAFKGLCEFDRENQRYRHLNPNGYPTTVWRAFNTKSLETYLRTGWWKSAIPSHLQLPEGF